MNDTLSQISTPTPILSLSNAPEPPQPEAAVPAGSVADQGLRSSQGIRWLLLAGALVCGVSVYRLVQTQWSILPAPLQFLLLVGGALSLFGLGRLTRRRLHLPYAGSALLSLFAGLVPVLAWGAVYLKLLDTPWGWLAFGAGLAVLLGAARRVLAEELKYSGLFYPAVLGVLLAAQAVLPWLSESLLADHPLAPGGVYATAALGLGLLLYFGALHVNRFFFHRDRRDGVERPVHFVPFLLLGLLYGGALMLLDPGSHFLALPLAVLGIVLASTGEEYHRALAASLGEAPARWPRRSVGLIAVGLGLLACSVPVALRDPSGVCLALVTLAAAVFLLRWGLHHRTATLYALGLGASLLAYTAAPALFRPVARWLLGAVTATTGVASDASLLALGQLGFFALLVAGALWLRRLDVPDRLRTVHAVAAGLQLVAVTFLALPKADGLRVLPAVLLLGVIATALTRRSELALACTLPSVALVLSFWGRDLGTFQTALLIQAFFATAWLLGRRSEAFYARSAKVAAFCHALLGLLALGLAVPRGSAGIEPLILLLLGAAFLEEGLRLRRRNLTFQGLGLLAAWPAIQMGTAVGVDTPEPWLAGLTVSAVVLAAMIRIARRGLGEEWKSLILDPLARLVHLWGMVAVLCGAIFAGPEALALTLALVALVYLSRRDLAGRVPSAALPLRPSLLLLAQVAALVIGPGERFLPAALAAQGLGLLPLGAGLALLWRSLGEALGRRPAIEPWSTALEGLTAFGYVAACTWTVGLSQPVPFSPIECLVLTGIAVLWALLSGVAAWRGRRERDVWAMQIWIGLGFVQALTAGWITLGNAPTPYLLLAAGAGLYGAAQLLGRSDLREPFFVPCRTTGLVLPVAAGGLALFRTWDAHGAAVWFPACAVFLVSLFYFVVATREERRVFPSLAAALFLGLPFLAVIDQTHLGGELYALAPGVSLLALAWLLRTELGERWSRHVVAAGASCLYATPIVALSDQISWGWLAALLVLATAFGAVSFGLRSRSLLTVSTAALLTDLGFFIFRIGTSAPTLLWVLGAAFGLAVMGAAAVLESRREDLLQQIRVFGRELQAWS